MVPAQETIFLAPDFSNLENGIDGSIALVVNEHIIETTVLIRDVGEEFLILVVNLLNRAGRRLEPQGPSPEYRIGYQERIFFRLRSSG